MILRNTLLSIHILAVIVWLGFGFYELLLTREIRKARGSAEEIPLIRIYGRYAGIVAIATLITALAGAAMTMVHRWGFFSVFWLGVKQGIMSAIILGMILLTPLFAELYKSIAAVDSDAPASINETREIMDRVEQYVLLMRVGGVIAVLLAVWKPPL